MNNKQDTQSECVMCNKPTNEIKDYPRIINLKPFPLCKRCQEIIKNV